MLARLLGREISESMLLLLLAWVGFRFGSGPKDSRETPDVLSRDMCLLTPLLDEMLLRKSMLPGVASWPPCMLDAVDPTVRLRLRIVTVDGTLIEERGEARGGVLMGAGSLERADWTRASRRAIWAVSVRICVSELEGGGL